MEAIRQLCYEEVTVTSSGRTDAGAHANGQFVQVDLKSSTSRYSEENLRRGLNERLPCSIRISKLAAVPPTFHAKRSSQKQYSYYFQLGSVALPYLRNITM